MQSILTLLVTIQIVFSLFSVFCIQTSFKENNVFLLLSGLMLCVFGLLIQYVITHLNLLYEL